MRQVVVPDHKFLAIEVHIQHCKYLMQDSTNEERCSGPKHHRALITSHRGIIH